jgi:DNA-binding MarR family transcriptional regulator
MHSVVERRYLVDMATTPTAPDLARDVWSRVMELWIRQRPRTNAAMTQLGLHPVQALALRLLEPGEPRPMSALAAQLHCDASNVTNIADRLEAMALVERRPSAHDRRVKTLVLTPEGEAMRDRVAAIWREPPAGFAALSEDDLATLERIVSQALDQDG